MKKSLLTVLCAILIVSASMGIFAACSAGDVVELAPKQGAEISYDLYQKADKKDFIAVITYSNGKKREIDGTNKDVVLGAIDTATPGAKNVVMVYGGKETTFHYTVTANIDESLPVVGFSAPDFQTEYELNKKGTGDSEFLDKTSLYMVGDDNAFHYMPKVLRLVSPTKTIIDPTYTAYDLKLEKKLNSTYTVLSQAQVEATLSHEGAGKFQFKTGAAGNIYRLTLSDQNNEDSINIEFKVIDGYNIYNEAELSRLDNVNLTKLIMENEDKGEGVWTSYKRANNIPLNFEASAFILHKNLELTRACLPTRYFDANNMLLDRLSLYEINFSKASKFNFYGNLFTIDAQKIALVGEDDGDGKNGVIVSNSQVFKFNVDENAAFDVTINVRDGSFIGNAQRSSSDTDTVRTAGLIGFATCAPFSVTGEVVYNFKNIISTSFIGDFVQENNTTLNLIQNRHSYAYNSALYLWNSKLTNVTDCIIKNSGGPLIMLVDANEKDEYFPTVKVNAGTSLTNMVTGSEPWFTVYSANSIVSDLKKPNEVLKVTANEYGKTASYVEDGAVGFIAVVMASDPFEDIGARKGVFEWEGNGKLDMTDPTFLGYKTATGMQAPIFQSGAGGSAYFNGTSFTNNTANLENTFFEGKSLNLFANANKSGNDGFIGLFVKYTTGILQA